MRITTVRVFMVLKVDKRLENLIMEVDGCFDDFYGKLNDIINISFTVIMNFFYI